MNNNGYERNLEEALLIPLLQSFVSGLLAGVLAFSGAAILHLTPRWPYFWGGWALVMFAAWFILLAKSWRLVERVLGIDIDGDGVIGEPEVLPAPVTRVEIIENGGRRVSFTDLPLEQERLIQVARSIVQGGDFSHASLAGPRKPLSRAEYEAMRDELLKRGMLRWNNDQSHNQGLQLTGKGQAVVRHYASITELPRLER